MDDDTAFVLEFIAAQTVFLSALIHLTLGVLNWLRYAQVGIVVPTDVRWPLFLVSGVAIILGLYVGSHRENRRPFYLAGIVMMAGYTIAYFGWHVSGHKPFLIFGRGAGNESISVTWFLDHLLAGPVEFTAILAQVCGVVLLAVLFVRD